MEKLIELLNEYQNGKEKSEQAKEYEVYKWELDSRWGIARYDADDPREWYNLYSDVTPSYLTSKSFWFIKWLVENDKTDYRKIIEKETEVWFKLIRIKDYPNKIMDEDVEQLLMLLAIQDDIINFLISILK